MARIVRWSPFREMVDMQHRMDRLFEEMTGNLQANEWTEAGNWLALDVHDNGENYFVEAELPGFNVDDIDITLHDHTLTISGESKREDVQEGERRIVSERRYGLFRRSVRLPDAVDADSVEAVYENGVLKLTLPKSEAAKPRQISVKNMPILGNEN